MDSKDQKDKKLIVLSSPSGGGKTTVARHLLKIFPQLKFSISATTRAMREGETNGRDYFFLSKQDFLQLVKTKGLVEWEEIYGNYYGTLRSEIDNCLNSNYCLLFDIDVKGAMSLRKEYPNDTVLFFLAPPEIDVAIKRLKARKTETPEQILKRIERMKMELEYQDKFDHVIVNNVLSDTLVEAEGKVSKYLPE
jgi:guanylate kinase